VTKMSQVEKTCEQCGEAFWIKKSKAAQRFCRMACQNAHEAIHGRKSGPRKPTFWFNCKQCGKPFAMKPGYLSQYRLKFGKDPMYCSIPCSAIGRRADTELRSTFTCEQCGKVNPMKRYEGTGRTVYYRQQKFCDNACHMEWRKARAAERFAEGNFKRRIKRGYAWVSVPSGVTGKKHEILEHRFVMEKFLGRPLLKTETVHHRRAWDKLTNTLDNLELRTGNHGPGGAVEDLVPWCVEMLMLYHQFITPELSEKLRTITDHSP
jgi:hypothetical protein